MTTLLIWTGILGYLIVTLFFARSSIFRWHRDSSSLLDIHDSADRVVYALAALTLGFIWPVAILFFLLRDWLWKPSDRDLERMERLREDRNEWRKKAYDHSATKEERRMASDIVNILDEILKGSN